MKNARSVMFNLVMMIILSACMATPTPLVVVVTATPLPSTEVPPTEAAPTAVPVALAGPQSGEKMKWIDGSTLIHVPPSEFKMGDGSVVAPEHNVTLEGYWIQQTKVTNRMYA